MEDGDLRPYLDAAQWFVEPIALAIETPEQAAALLEDLGYISDKQVTAFTEAAAGVDMVVDAITALIDAVEAEEEDAALVALGELLLGVGRVFVVVKDFAAKIQANFAGSDILTETDILTEVPRRLADYLVVRLLEDHYPMVFASLMLLGAIEIEQVDDTPTSFHAPYLKRVVNWEQIPERLSDPVKSIEETLSNGEAFAYELLLYLVRQFAVALGLPVTYDVPKEGPLAAFNEGDPTQTPDFDELTMLRFLLVADPAAELGVELYPRLDSATGKRTGIGAGIRFGSEIEIPLGEVFKLVLKIAASLEDSLGVVFKKGEGVQFVNKLFTGSPEQLADSVQLGVTASIVPAEGKSADGKLLSLGLPLGRLEIGAGDLTAGVEKQADFRFFAETSLSGGVLEIGTEDADGFIGSIMQEPIRAEFSLGVGVSSNAGLYFKGSSALSIRLPLHLALGPVEIPYVTLGAEFKGKEVPLIAATGLSAKIGPLAAVVEDIGVKAIFKAHADSSGNAGPLDVGFGFKPPKGVGLSIDAGVVKGGGYLFLDPDAGEYAGALELTVAGWLSLKAIGLITTKMPDGSNGFSLLVIITAEFGTGLQLGYGFTLIGVGGLLGLNRTMKLLPLMEGVRTGAVNGIMFPADPVANAPRIISDLKAIFPPQQDVFLIGPMAKLGWGTPTLVSLSLGVIIEIPGNIAILGVLAMQLPTAEEAILSLQVNFAGAIEFDKKRVYFFAALFDSRVLTMTLEGEMAVLAAFGDDANFVLSVGGFHPNFSPPPLPVPTPKRLALTILNESAAKLRAEAYFALTTNTVQFGAKVEAFFGFDSFSVEGNLAFDALFQFSPFHFEIAFSASFGVKVFGTGIFSVRSNFMLEGPTPWRAHGTGSISILFFDIDVGFDITWGEEQDTTLPPVAVMPMLQAELEKPANWRALVPAANNLLVSLRQLDPAAEELVLHPLGTLRVSQRAVPLDLKIDKVGSQKPSDANRFSLSVTAGPLDSQGDVKESFAPAQFLDLSDTEKLSRPAFEPDDGGLDLSAAGAQIATGTAIKRTVRYELATIDTYYRRFARPFRPFPGSLWEHFLDGAAVARSPHSRFEQKLKNPFEDKVTAGDEVYVVAHQADNRAFASGEAKFTSASMAREYMVQTVAEDPSLDGQLHVIPEFEAVAA